MISPLSDEWDLITEEELAASLLASSFARRPSDSSGSDLRSTASSTVVAPEFRPRRAAGITTKLCSIAAWVAVLFAGEVYDIGSPREEPIEVEDPAEAEMSSRASAWDRRYLRQSPHGGVEILLLGKGSETGWKAAVLPDGSIAEVPMLHRKTVSPVLSAAVTYTPMPVLTETRKKEIMDAYKKKLERKRSEEDRQVRRGDGQDDGAETLSDSVLGASLLFR